jgi:hypothetical protein
MRVTLGHSERGVPKDLLHDPDVNALFEEQRGCSVAGIVGSSIAEAGRLQHLLEVSPVTPWIDGLAGRPGEDKIPVLPLVSGCETLCGLSDLLSLQLRDQRLRDDAPARLPAFRWPEKGAARRQRDSSSSRDSSRVLASGHESIGRSSGPERVIRGGPSSWQPKAAISPNSQIASELDVAPVWFDVIGLAQLHGCGAELP